MINQSSTALEQASYVGSTSTHPSPSPGRDAANGVSVLELVSRHKPIAIEARVKGTLHVVMMILRRNGAPMSVRQIVEQAGTELPTRSKTPMTVVARDLAMDIKNKGEGSAFVRTAPGRFTLRALLAERNASASEGEGLAHADVERVTFGSRSGGQVETGSQ